MISSHGWNTDETRMKLVANITFTVLDTLDEALAIVRADESSAAIGLSLKSDGNLQLVKQKPQVQLPADTQQKAAS